MNTALTIRIPLLVVIATLPLVACGGNASHQSLKIMPQDCSLLVSEVIGLTLNGEIDPNSQVTWEASLGTVVSISQGIGANYTAPSVAGEALIKATVTSGVGSNSNILTTTCKVIDPSATLPSSASNQPESVLPPQPEAQKGKPTIIISEVMGNACGGIDQRKYNQYLELYNYGDQPVDIGGFHLYDEGNSGTPDEITAWNRRSGLMPDGPFILDTTVIPAKGVAVVLSPQYYENPMGAPYTLPAGTIVLTVAESATLGDDYFGIITDQNGYDTVTLYTGSGSIINTVVDTYGTPSVLTSYPFDIDDNHKDNVPRYLSECTSIERINPLMPDSESNWTPVKNGSPGEVPFH
jgi:hypothetical protein